MRQSWPGRLNRIAATLVALLSFWSAPARALEPTPTTASFVADTWSANLLLAETSRRAAASDNGALQQFARRELPGRENVLRLYADWARAQSRERQADDMARTLDGLGRIFGPTDRLATVVVAPPAPDLAALAAARGPAFDALYLAAQTQALETLVAVDKVYILNGDDETLRALAVHDLPRVEALLAAVRRLA